jgi:pimeloyl-ACP methyl ester carboxylesterase
LFQFRGIAERWLSHDGFAKLRGWSGHPDIDAVVERLSEPGALTASLNLYRAMLPPESLVAPPPAFPPILAPAMGVWSSGDRALTEEAMTGTQMYVTGPWRYERLAGPGHWLQLEAPDAVNDLLLDFLGEHRDLAVA